MSRYKQGHPQEDNKNRQVVFLGNYKL